MNALGDGRIVQQVVCLDVGGPEVAVIGVVGDITINNTTDMENGAGNNARC